MNKLFFLLFLNLSLNLFGQNTNTTEKIEYVFSEDGKECIIKSDNLSRPWLNRLGNDEFFTWVTHNGYIESFLLDPSINGLVNPQDVSGHFYIKDLKSGDFFLINESESNSNWESTIGLGYNIVKKKELDLETELTYFIPRNDNVLIIKATVENKSKNTKDLSIMGQVEWNLGDVTKKDAHPSDGLGGSQHNLYKKVFVTDGIMYAEQTNWRSTANSESWPYTGFFTTSNGINSYETKITPFLGAKKNWDRPKGLKQNSLSNTNFNNYDEFPLGVIENKMVIPPGETHNIIFILGMDKDKNNIRDIVKKFSEIENANNALLEVKEYYEGLLKRSVYIETPDKDNDRIINIWSQYHWRQTFKKDLDSQSLGAGFWAYGLEGGSLTLFPELLMMGHADPFLKSSMKDILFANQNPDVSKNTIHLSPPAMLNTDLGIEWPPKSIPDGHSVPHHHYIYTQLFGLYYYLLESGNMEFLQEEVGYLDGSSGTVFDHVVKAMDITLKGIGDRGLYKIPKDSGDWMDEFTKISRTGDAESVMLSAQVAYLLKNYATIATLMGHEETASNWQEIYKELKATINKYAWDGDWYIRAFADNPDKFQPVGSKANKEGKIYLNAQSWMIFADIAPIERAEKSLSSVKKHLSSDFGPLVFAPSYSEYVDYIGTQSIYAPGFRNANIYFRPTGWAVIAAAMTGDAEMANILYQTASLSNRSKDMDRYLLEPFAYPENYIGPDHENRGEGQFHWCFGEGTGWMWYSYVSYILGVRSELNGLVIDPKIPKDWDGYKIRKHFRNATYQIEVRNPKHVSKGIKWIKVDGQRINGTLIKPHKDNRIHQIEVMMGS